MNAPLDPMTLAVSRAALEGCGALPTNRSLLATIDSPDDLRRLAREDLPQLADEVRAHLVDCVATSGGHFAAGLGTVELTVALHYVFDTPRDAIVWDVGHQCYPHKILTGRRDRLTTVRRRGGLAGFLRRDESRYDAFGAGHSSTSISAALGMALANAQLGRDARAVAVIGDGGMTAGLAFEALNHAGASDADLLVVLNDNRMSISPNVGALSEYCRALVDCAGATGTDGAGPATIFEQLGLRYAGPVDGHDLPRLLAALQSMRDVRGPRLLHVITNKGHGYARAAAEPVKYHAVTPFDPRVGTKPAAPAAPTYTEVFGQWLCRAAAADARVVAITPAMREGSGLVQYSQRFADRYVDVGIAEQHSVTLAAGMAVQGMRPVVAIYSTFLQRAFDQLVHDVALQKLPVLFAIDRAGLVGPDGATHNGSLDLSYLRCVPDMVVMAPSDGNELRDMLATGLAHDGPCAVRYPRCAAGAFDPEAAPRTLPIGISRQRRAGKRIALLSFGSMLDTAMAVGEELGATVVDMRFVKPLDTAAVLQ
ncbi:MAG: 1-deoxy-D-xylulose-5-phosphate synthase, partial [Burkholderiaceae bacterium]|nr:1-deoxy-D-xylulose-5-phosphate synthase [Burkholderiaceae bacterium]